MSLNFKILQESFARVKPHGTKFASRFYYNLFQDYPQLQSLFANTNMEEQDEKLMQTLVLAIYNEYNLSYLKTILQDLGKRHVRYGIIPEHYPIVGVTLLKTFEDYLGTEWTPEVKQAWTDAYTEIVNFMLAGADSPEESPSPKLENSFNNVCPNPTKLDFTPTQSPTTTSSQNYSSEIPELENHSRLCPNPITTEVVPAKPSATSSSQTRKLAASNLWRQHNAIIFFTVAGLLGIGIFLYYHGSLTTDPTVEQRDSERQK